MKKKILRFYLLFFILTFADSSEVWSLSAELGEDGVVRLSGSHSFECSPESYEDDKKSYAVAYLACGMPSCYSDDAGVFYSGSPSVAFNAEYNLSCRYPGPYEFGVGYVGGKWVDLMNGDRACTNNAFYESAEIYLPAGPQIDIISNDLVKGVKPIGVTYDFTYSAAMESSDIRQIQAYIDNALIYNKSDLSENGSAQISYNFSNKKGFILIKVSAGCGSNNNTVEKLVYVEPEDSCPLNVGKPVNAASGNVYTSETDFTLKGLTPITFTRHYDGSESTMRDFGQTWTHNYDTRVTKFANSAGNTYKVINPDGSNVYYIDNGGDGIYDVEFPKGEKSRLIKNPDNTFTREYFDGSKEEFNSYGRLTAVLDRNGSATALTRGANNNLTKITDPVGREINFTYNTSNKITSITIPDGSPAGRIYSYAYLSSGYLGKVTYPDGSERNYEYKNITGVGSKLSGIKDERGNYIEKHDYDSQGRATTSSSDGTNEKLTINYISDTQSTVTDSFGRVTTYTIDKTSGQSHPTNISGTGCKSCGQGDTTKTYDNNLNVTSITDANGNVTIMTYDARGNMLTRTEASGTPQQRTTTYTYNEFGQVLTGTDNDGNITSHTYDTSGNMLTKTEAYGTINERTTAYTYNAYGQIPTTTDPTGNITTNTYDRYGNLTSVTNALNQTITHEYDVMGNLLSTTDADGNTTTYQYDSRDRLTKETKSEGGIINYEYDSAGNRTAVIDANGNRTTYVYDNINRLIELRTPNSELTIYTYDTEGNMTSMTIKDSANNVITSESHTYDDHNRLTRTIHADGTYTEQSYDALGNVISKRDENDNITSFTYDGLNRLAEVRRGELPFAPTNTYTYDSRNNLTSITDANGNLTTYNYDSLNRLISTTSPDTGTTTYTYDANGNMITKTDANNMTITYSYDTLNRQTAIQFPDATQNINYFYDDPQTRNGKGRLTSMIDPSGTTWHEYDKMGRVTMETKQIGDLNYRTEYTYDLNGNVLTITYPGGRVIAYGYNQLNKAVSSAEEYIGATSTLANNITYQPFGDIASMTYGNGITTVKAYDNRNRLANLSTQNSRLQTLNSYSYTRDNTGNITAITDDLNHAKNKSYTYDPLNGLTIAAGPWGALTYSYDPAGNRTYETTDTGNTTYNYIANKLTSSSGEKVLNFGYDNNGNTTAENNKQYIYNQNQRLAQVTDSNTVSGEYVYNGKGQRIKKCTENGTRCAVYHYDQNGLLIAESTDTGTITAEYAYLNGQPLAKMDTTISGAAYNYPEAPGFTANLSLNVNTSSLAAGHIKYLFKRMSLTNTTVTGLSITGKTATVTALGTVNNIGRVLKETIPGCTITVTITDGDPASSLPDAMGIEIRRPDGTLYYSAGLKAVVKGNFTIKDNVYYYHNDHLGTPMLMTDSSGKTVWQGEFKPFGEPLSVSGSITNNLRFPGQYYDAETGLHQNWHRDYKAEIGRYVESDPILQPMVSKTTKTSCVKSTVTWRVPLLISNPQDLYSYVYTKANPINLMDPSGLVCGSGWTDKIVPDSYGNFDFTRPCENHDKCYDSCGKSKPICDVLFFNNMMQECSKLTWNPISQLGCIETATIYYTAVVTFGYPAYNNAQKGACCKK